MAIGSFASGFYLKYKFDKAEEAKYYKTLVSQIQHNDEQARKTASDYQSKLTTLTTQYNDLQERANHVKVTTTKCTVTRAGVRVWNDSSKGKSSTVSKDTARVIETPTTASTVTVEELVQNKIQNDEICNGLRLQLEALIKWDQDEFNSR